MNTQEIDGYAYAVELAAALERALAPGAVSDTGILDEAFFFVADTRHILRVALAVGSPHAELVLGDGTPRVEVWWGGTYTCTANLDADFVRRYRAVQWQLTMEDALDRRFV